MASHLHHVDAVGIGIVDEREHRPEPAKTSVTLAHVARIISDCNVYSFMRLITAYLCAGEDTKCVHDVWDRHEDRFRDLAGAQEEWENIRSS